MPFISKSFWGFFWELFIEHFAPLRSGSCWTLGRNHFRAFRVGSKGFSESWFSTFHPQASLFTRLFFWELIGIFSRSCSHWSIEHPFFNGLGMNLNLYEHSLQIGWLANQYQLVLRSLRQTSVFWWTYCSRNWSKPHSSTDSKLSPNGNGNPRDFFLSVLVCSGLVLLILCL